jgi:hypothetical protein
LLEGTKEYQVGLKAFSQQQEAWGMNLFNSNAQPIGKVEDSVTA